MKKCTDYEVESVTSRGRSKKTWSKVTEKDCRTRQICKEDAMDWMKRRKLKMSYNSHKDKVWVSEWMFFWYWLTQVIPGKGSLNRLAVKCVVAVAKWHITNCYHWYQLASFRLTRLLSVLFPLMQLLSALCPVIHCSVSNHVTMSMAFGQHHWNAGVSAMDCDPSQS